MKMAEFSNIQPPLTPEHHMSMAWRLAAGLPVDEGGYQSEREISRCWLIEIVAGDQLIEGSGWRAAAGEKGIDRLSGVSFALHMGYIGGKALVAARPLSADMTTLDLVDPPFQPGKADLSVGVN